MKKSVLSTSIKLGHRYSISLPVLAEFQEVRFTIVSIMNDLR